MVKIQEQAVFQEIPSLLVVLQEKKLDWKFKDKFEAIFHEFLVSTTWNMKKICGKMNKRLIRTFFWYFSSMAWRISAELNGKEM